VRVFEIMADPITVRDDAVLSQAVRLMDEHAIRHLPVVRGDALVGVLSDRDLLEPAGKLVPRLSEEGELEPLLVRGVMQAHPETMEPEATLAAAAGALAEWSIGCLPVTRGGALVGLVTETDLLEALSGSNRRGGPKDAGDPPVGRRMTADPVTACTETTLAEAGRRMCAGGLRHLPVTDAGRRLVGLVSDRDLRRAAGRGLDPNARVVDLPRRRTSTSSLEERISRAAQRTSRERIDALPVVDDDRRLVGILTATDVLAHCADVLA
jgi:CBS domain-containing protein